MPLNRSCLTRRELGSLSVSALATARFAQAAGQEGEQFRLNYMLASCMYGYQYLGEILPEVTKVGATAIDIWPKVHGNQREQLDDLGEDKFRGMLSKHQIRLGCLTQYKLGPFNLQDEMRLAKRLGCSTIVTGGKGPKGLGGTELKVAVGKFVEQMKPHLAVASECDVVVAIENHANNLIESPDSLRWLAESAEGLPLRIALAPYHLEQDSEFLSSLIRDLGPSIQVFYAWQHGHGCMKKLPKEEELLQMPGRGDLDFKPLLHALQDIGYNGWTEIFMHPVPRGVPIHPMANEVTAEINRSRDYLESLI